jgi:cation transport regulator ChaB
MTYETKDQLPQEIREQLPEHAQQIFVAAFNAAQRDGMSEDGACNVAWNSVRIDILLDLNVEGFSKSHSLDFCFPATASTPKVFRSYVRSTDLNSRMSLGM